MKGSRNEERDAQGLHADQDEAPPVLLGQAERGQTQRDGIKDCTRDPGQNIGWPTWRSPFDEKDANGKPYENAREGVELPA